MQRTAWTGALALILLATGCGGPRPSAHVDFATIDATPAWSPDGRLIAFASSRSGGGIYVVRSDGTGIRRLVRGAASDPAWSPDGGWLAYSGMRGVYLGQRDGRHKRRILRGPFSLPAWAPDGQRLAVVRNAADAVTDIYVLNRDGSRLRRLVRPHLPRSDPRWNLVDAGETEPSWSPDGQELVVEAGNETILAYRLADRRYRRIVENEGVEPVWSPNGKADRLPVRAGAVGGERRRQRRSKALLGEAPEGRGGRGGGVTPVVVAGLAPRRLRGHARSRSLHAARVLAVGRRHQHRRAHEADVRRVGF